MEVNPLVSVVIPAFNAESFIRETISSVIKQSYKNFEIIVVNDGSTDKTQTILEELSQKHREIQVVNQSNQGVSAARNKGIELAKGTYVAFLDADDYWLDTNLSKKVDALTDPKIDYCYSDAYDCDEHLNIINLPKTKELHILDNLLFWNNQGNLPGPSSNIVIKKSSLENSLLRFNENLSNLADHHFCVMLAAHCLGTHIREPLWKYRIHQSNMSKGIRLLEQDVLRAYSIYNDLGIFPTGKLRKRAYASMYIMLSGSWWNQGKNKCKGVKYLLTAFFTDPIYTMSIIFSRLK